MIRVLQAYPIMNNAGTENVIMNWYKNINREKVSFDFLVQSEGQLDNEIREMGGRIFYIKNSDNNQYKKHLSKFFSENKYDVVHTHTHKEMGLILECAKKNSIACRIAHSHNARTDLGNIYKFMKKIKSFSIKMNATDFLACSKEAGEWLFPYKNIDIKIVRNAIDIEKFKFDYKKRNKIRDELNIKENELLLGHVGRLAKEKNQEYILKIVSELSKRKEQIKLLLIGDGPLRIDLENKAKELGIRKSVIFLGNINNVSEVLNAIDIFVFPSMHEGLGMVAIESQMNGLKTILSKNVPQEAIINKELCRRLCVNNINDWIVEILNLRGSLKRKEAIELNENYDIKKMIKELEKIYLGDK